MKVKAHARVQITLDIPVTDVWGDDCKVDQIHKQAAESAIQELRLGVSIHALQAGGRRPNVEATIVGEPRVTIVLVEEDR